MRELSHKGKQAPKRKGKKMEYGNWYDAFISTPRDKAKEEAKKWEEYNNYIEEKYQIPTIKEYFKTEE